MIRLIATTTALLLAATAALADPAEGLWATAPDDNGHTGQILIVPCGDRVCGTLVKAFDKDGAEFASANIGRQIVWDMLPQGDGAYGEGKVWSPDRDKTYSAKMKLTGDRLAVSGCVMGFCRDGGTWTRVK